MNARLRNSVIAGVMMAVAVTGDVTRVSAQEPNIVFGPKKAGEKEPEGNKESESEKARQSEVETKRAGAGEAPVAEPSIKPRLELHSTSVKKLIDEARRAESGFLLSTVAGMLSEMGRASSEGVDVHEAAGVLQTVLEWPDTGVAVCTYAPDFDGRWRWSVRLDWPLEDLHKRAVGLVKGADGPALFEGLSIEAMSEGGYRLRVRDGVIGYLRSAGEGASYFASHADLVAPDAMPFGAPPAEGPAPLLTCRLNLKGTEQNTGGTVFSDFHFVTALTYRGHVNGEKQWVETVEASWPMVSGMGAKGLLGRVKKTFFVPDAALGALVVEPAMGAGMLDQMAGFGMQMVMNETGQWTMEGEPGAGPIVSHGGGEIGLVVLPGEGFIPVPDLIFQFRTSAPDEFVEQVRKSIVGINKRHVEREQPEPWREAEVKDRAVFWRQGASSGGMMMMPFVMRPVLFTTHESDAEGAERHCIVLAMTSADPERLVERWTALPRNKEFRHLPASTKTNGQGWINWPVVYRTLGPYVNLSLSAVVRDAILPELNGDHTLRPSLIDAKIGYTGLEAGHEGPVPLGAFIVPAMAAAALAEDRSGGSDLARERLACERLRVFHHHATLFQKDHDRWPAALAELDGYVDFAGHPELLELELSPRKEWANVFQGMFGAEEGDDKDEEDEADADIEDDAAGAEIDDKLFEVKWAPTTWQLGLAAKTLDHLESLYIDQDGKIHRVVKEATDAPAEAVTTTP